MNVEDILANAEGFENKDPFLIAHNFYCPRTEFEAPKRIWETRAAWATGDTARDKDNKDPEDVEQFLDLSYGPLGESNLLDIYKPKEITRKLPVILNIHGGAYFYGDKFLYHYYCCELAKYGFAVIGMNYRLAPEYHFPGPIEDIHAAIAFAIQNADAYGLDLEHFFLVGDSAGAQLASHYAIVHSNPSFAARYGLAPHAEIKLCALGLACGLYDVRRRARTMLEDERVFDYLGEQVKLEDPRLDLEENITEAFPPSYLFTSECDFLKGECEPMAMLLRSRGCIAEYDVYGSKDTPEINHVFHMNLQSAEGRKAIDAQMAFFERFCR